MKIYKYFSFSQELQNDPKIESLRNNYLWFSKPKFFNDPFDCNMEVLNYSNNTLNKLRRLKEHDKDIIIENTKHFGICCFSKTNDNIHLWSHYTDRHKGICVEYDCDDFDDYFSLLLECKCHLLEVQYRNLPINFNENIEIGYKPNTQSKSITQILEDPLLLDLLFEKLLLQKDKKIWSKEKELRLIIGGLARDNKCIKEENGGYKVPIKVEIIKSITFGVNAPELLINEIKSIFEDKVEYKIAILDFQNRKINIE